MTLTESDGLVLEHCAEVTALALKLNHVLLTLLSCVVYNILSRSHIHPEECQILAELLLSLGRIGPSSHFHWPESAFALVVRLLDVIRVILAAERHLTQVFSFMIHFNPPVVSDRHNQLIN